MLINKPQFDTKAIPLGSAYFIKHNGDGAYNYNFPCSGIVEYVEPLRIKFIYLRTKRKSYDINSSTPCVDSIFIDVDKVVDGTYKLERLVPIGIDQS